MMEEEGRGGGNDKKGRGGPSPFLHLFPLIPPSHTTSLDIYVDTSAGFPTTEISSIITVEPLTLVLITYNTYYPIGELSLFPNH